VKQADSTLNLAVEMQTPETLLIKLSGNTGGDNDPLGLGVVRDVLDLGASLQNLSDLVGPDSSVRPSLERALEELGNAGRSVADVAELLKRDPNSLLVGRKSPKAWP
jgi:hypothetical protein